MDVILMDLNKEIQSLAKANGVFYCGVADLSRAKEFIRPQGGSELGSYTYSISLGIPLFKDIVDRLPDRSQHSVALNYHHCYEITNHRLDIAASIVASYLQDKGYRVLPLPASKRIDDERLCASFSHKLGARLAGFGWIGKSCLLITPDHGPRVRWVSILTDAPLETSHTIMDSKCGNCNACVDICPVQAFTGHGFKEEEPREIRYDAHKCERYINSLGEGEKIKVCGMCLYVCPYGQKNRHLQN